MTEQEDRFADRLHHRDDILALIFQAMTFGRLRLAPAPPDHGVDGELLLEQGFHELPVRPGSR